MPQVKGYNQTYRKKQQSLYIRAQVKYKTKFTKGIKVQSPNIILQMWKHLDLSQICICVEKDVRKHTFGWPYSMQPRVSFFIMLQAAHLILHNFSNIAQIFPLDCIQNLQIHPFVTLLIPIFAFFILVKQKTTVDQIYLSKTTEISGNTGHCNMSVVGKLDITSLGIHTEMFSYII